MPNLCLVEKKTEESKCNYLMLWVGEKGRQIFSTWNIDAEAKKLLQTYYDGFANYCAPKSNHIYSRYKFKSRIQQEGEVFEQFVTELKIFIKDCGYPDTIIDEMIRDHIVFGIRSHKIREKLISEGSGLTLEKCTDIARTYELSQTQVKDINCQSQSVNAVERNPMYRAAQKKTRSTMQQTYSRNPQDRQQRPFQGKQQGGQYDTHRTSNFCDNCENSKRGYNDMCPAKGKFCDYCTKPNHFAKVCRRRKLDNNKINEVTHFDTTSDLEYSSLDTPSHDDEFYVNTVEHDHITNQAFATITIGSTPISMKINSGAQVNCLPRSVYASLKIAGPLTPNQKRLTGYDGKPLKVDGIIKLPLKYNGQTFYEEFYIVGSRSQPIIGLQTCLKLNVMKLVLAVGSDSHPTKESVLGQYPDIFQGIGQLPGECQIHLREDATPVIHPPRKVPIAIKDTLKAELDHMESQDIIAKVTEPTEWVNSLVTVEKSNGSLRICLDPKDLNNAIKRPHYPNKTLEDILPELSHATVFSKFDARSCYWSIKLTEESSYLTCFNTPFQRYRFLRLPFGVSCANDLFQSKIDQCLENLPGVTTIVDDIVVYGKDHTEHNTNIHMFMQRCREMAIKLNPDKTEIGKSEIPFFGHLLTSKGLKMDPSKVKAIEQMPSPTTKSELQTVLGMITYLQRFAPNLSEITTPLR
ncbi:uncharacterized protein K02A2.6-like [Mercenaria mercenaria]|uniref:uncharacterized protein K02A2.6-like n=1 Tax=Mercenaria mercenaria TaxID=6596 RepID=UPI00234F8C38|nr:uncharacterized protein K02A2.6-like [Mercenaria mercenaria]